MKPLNKKNLTIYLTTNILETTNYFKKSHHWQKECSREISSNVQNLALSQRITHINRRASNKWESNKYTMNGKYMTLHSFCNVVFFFHMCQKLSSEYKLFSCTRTTKLLSTLSVYSNPVLFLNSPNMWEAGIMECNWIKWNIQSNQKLHSGGDACYSRPSIQLIPCTKNIINGCQAASQRIQSKKCPYRIWGRSQLPCIKENDN